MKQKKIFTFITAVLCLICFSGSGYGFDYRFGAEVFEGLFVEDNYLDEATATFGYDETYNILGLYPDCRVDFGAGITGYAQGELEWIHSWDAPDADDVDGDLAIGFLGYSGNGFSADAGLLPFDIGDGTVFYSEEPGISLRYRGWKHMHVSGEALTVFDRSPMVKITAGYVPGFMESVELIGAWYHDADDRIAGLYRTFYEDADIESTGNLFWAGGQGDFFVYDLFVSCLVLYQFGAVEIDDGTGAVDYDVSAYLADVEVNYNITGQLSAAGFVFAASGDESPGEGRLTAFMSPMPFNRTTSIFFNGGFRRYDIKEEVRLGGVTWDGVIAPGMKLEYQPGQKIIAEVKGVMMFPAGDLFKKDDWYGWEADTRLSYEFYPGQRLFAEAGIFRHGNYFRQRYGYRPESATRFVAGMSLIF